MKTITRTPHLLAALFATAIGTQTFTSSAFAQSEAGHGGDYTLIGTQYVVKDLFVKPKFEEMTLRPEVIQYLDEIDRIFSTYHLSIGLKDILTDVRTEFRFNPDAQCGTHQGGSYPVYNLGCITPSGVFYLTDAFINAPFKDKILFLAQEAIFYRYQVSEGTYYRVSQTVDLIKLMLTLVEQQNAGRKTVLTANEVQTLNEIYPRIGRLGKTTEEKCEIDPNGGGCIFKTSNIKGTNFISVGSSVRADEMENVLVMRGSHVTAHKISDSTVDRGSQVAADTIENSTIDLESVIQSHTSSGTCMPAGSRNEIKNSSLQKVKVKDGEILDHVMFSNVTAEKLIGTNAKVSDSRLLCGIFKSSTAEQVESFGPTIIAKDATLSKWLLLAEDASVKDQKLVTYEFEVNGIQVQNLSLTLTSLHRERGARLTLRTKFVGSNQNYAAYGSWTGGASENPFGSFFRMIEFSDDASRSFSVSTAKNFYNAFSKKN